MSENATLGNEEMLEFPTLTDEEIAAQDQARAAAESARLAPFRALRRRMDAGLRYAVANDGVTDEELLTMQAATPEWRPGIAVSAGDTLQYDGSTYMCLQGHTSQTGWEPPNAPALWQLKTD